MSVGNQLHYGSGDNRRRSDGITIRYMVRCDIDEFDRRTPERRLMLRMISVDIVTSNAACG